MVGRRTELEAGFQWLLIDGNALSAGWLAEFWAGGALETVRAPMNE